MSQAYLEWTLNQSILRHISSEQYNAIILDLVSQILQESPSIDINVSNAHVLIGLLEAENVNSQTGSPACRRKAVEALVIFTRKLLLDQSTPDDQAAQSAARLCATYHQLRGPLIQDCIDSFLIECHRLSSNDDLLAVPSKELLHALISSTSTSQDRLDANVAVKSSLNFLRILLTWRVPMFNTQNATVIAKTLLVMVASVSIPLSSLSKDVLCAMLSSNANPDKLSLSSPFGDDLLPVVLWDRIVELTRESSPAHYKSCAYMIWLRALSSTYVSFPTPTLLQSQGYWKTLHQGLAHGSSEQQKCCLAIARQSLAGAETDINNDYMEFAIDKRDEYSSCFAKFCTVYETVASRYLNQVQECFPDLDVLANPTTKIHKSWLVALLTSALGPGNQESIRTIVGSWCLKQIPLTLKHCIDISPEFLQRSFLPWATTGSHFTTSLTVTTDKVPVCVHGEALMRCLQDLIESVEIVRHRNTLVKSILFYLQLQSLHIFSSARMYTLEGVRRGISNGPKCLDRQDLEVVLKIGTTGGFQDIMNDFMMYQCSKIIQHSVPETGVSEYDHLLRAAKALETRPKVEGDDELLEAAALRFRDIPSSPSDLTHERVVLSSQNGSLEVPPLAKFGSYLAQNGLRNLRAHGMQNACDYLAHVLEKSHLKDLEPDILATALDAIWDEVEVQDYPKRILMKLPGLILHPKCVQKCSSAATLTASVSSIAQKLQRLAVKRVYAYYPFSKALHTCIFKVKHTACLPIVDIFVNFANDPPAAKVEFKLAAVTAEMFSREISFRDYEYYLGQPEGRGHALLFIILNRWPKSRSDLAQQIVDRLLIPWMKQKSPVPIFSKWKTTFQVQIVLILMQRILGILSPAKIDNYLNSLYHVLSLEPLPRYRYLFEWIISRIYVQYLERRGRLLDSLDNADLTNPKFVVSLMKIASLVSRLPDIREEFLHRYMTQLVTFAASPKIVLRHEAQWSFPALWEVGIKKGWKSILGNPCFDHLNSFIRSFPTYHNPPAGRLLERFDPNDHNLVHLVSGSYLEMEPSETPRLYWNDLVAVQKDVTVTTGEGDFEEVIPLGSAPITEGARQLTIRHTTSQSSNFGTSQSSMIPLQIKANPWNLESARSDSQSRKTSPLVIVASLIDSSYNLGGIVRASEILGASTLYMHRPSSVLKDRAFTTLSVSSELWLPIRTLAPTDIPSFLTERKLEGYEAVGVEQTDSSRTLGEKGTVFKEKTVLVLGSEREGIPATVLSECNWCVEIKQRGVTRSLNVQTAASCVMYEYCRTVEAEHRVEGSKTFT